jgi:hypothetical protein
MLQITPHVRILVAIEPVDLRKGIDGLAQFCREKLQEDPFSGCLFVFRGRRAKAVKVLQFDGQGFVLGPELTFFILHLFRSDLSVLNSGPSLGRPDGPIDCNAYPATSDLVTHRAKRGRCMRVF